MYLKLHKTMKHKRLILGIILTVILILLMIYSSVGYSDKEFDILYIFENYETYDNKISFVGEIVEINETSQTLTIRCMEPPYSLIEIKTHNIEFKEYIPKKGDIVEILGTEDEENNVIAEKMLISERWKYDLIYIRSLPAIPFALYLFFRTWKFNQKKLRFERRKTDA